MIRLSPASRVKAVMRRTSSDMERTALPQCSGYTFMYVECGEEALAEIAKAIAARLGLGAPQSWSAEQAITAWGWNMAVFSLGSNSRVRGKAATDLGWSPTRRSVTTWIANELT